MDSPKHNNPIRPMSSCGSSPISGLSLLEDEAGTDELSRVMLEHARADHQRLQQAIQGEGLRGFRKARPLSRATTALTLENLERNTAIMESGNTLDRPSMRHQRSISEGQFENHQPNVPRRWGSKGRQKNEFLKRLSSLTPTDDFVDDKPLDPDTIYKRRTVLTGDSPRSDVDWTSAAADVPLPSIEQGSPSLRPRTHHGAYGESLRSSSLDHILRLEREIEGLETPMLDRTAKSSVQFKHAAYEVEQKQDLEDNASLSKSLQPKPPQPDIPPKHLKTPGSRDLLKQLARASSVTPSPPSKEPLDRYPKAISSTHDKTPWRSFGNLDYRLSQRLPTPPDDSPEHTQDLNLAGSKTPLVTGAWIDTPVIQRKSEDKLVTSTTPSQSVTAPVVRQESKHPKSALEVVLRESKKKNIGDDNYNESTINSLKDLLEQDIDLSTVLPFDADTMALVENVGVPLNQAQRERQQEIFALQRMTERLRSARSGLRDASLGMKRVEDEVEIMDQLMATHSRCIHCGQAHFQGTITLFGLIKNDIKRLAKALVYWPQRNRFPWPTRTGWVVLFVLFYVYSELALLINPFYYRPMNDYSEYNDYKEAFFPFATFHYYVLHPWRIGWRAYVRYYDLVIWGWKHFAYNLVKEAISPEYRAYRDGLRAARAAREAAARQPPSWVTSHVSPTAYPYEGTKYDARLDQNPYGLLG